MRYKAQDLRERYNIESVFVDEKNQVDVIKKLISAVNKNKVFISGAYYNVSAVKNNLLIYSPKLLQFAFWKMVNVYQPE